MYAIESMPPSTCDESLPIEQAHERRAQYVNIMTHIHSIKPVIAVAVARQLSPSTSSTLRKFNATEIMAEYEECGGGSDPQCHDANRLFGAPLSTEAVEMLMPLAAELTELEQSRKVRPGFQGGSKLGAATDNFGKRIALLLSGFTPELEDTEDWGLVACATGDGWSMVKGFSFDDYDIEDLEPHMLAPLRRF